MVELTMLSAMAGQDVTVALDRHVECNIRLLDLKDGLFGKSICDLTDAQAITLRSMADDRGLKVYCLSTELFHAEVELGEAHFRDLLPIVDRTIEIAKILQPQVIRLLSAATRQRDALPDAVSYVSEKHSWLFDCYREAIGRIDHAGFIPMIENEVAGSIFSTPAEIIQFFECLDRPCARLIWDIGNLWQMGTLPTMAVYEQLRPLIGGLHLKGGRSEPPSTALKWRGGLEDTSWPVVPIVQRAVAEDVTSVICINPPHGIDPPGTERRDFAKADLDFLRGIIKGIA